jgi:hypothetical protein
MTFLARNLTKLDEEIVKLVGKNKTKHSFSKKMKKIDQLFF